jgi:hypothetical protein
MENRTPNATASNDSERLPSKISSKEALLSSAAILFTDRCYDGVSTREIAEHAGVNLALIQYHFGSKAKLFLETVDHLTDSSSNLQDWLRPIPETASSKEGAVELTYFIRDFLTFLLQSAEAHSSCRLIYRELFSGSSKDPELFESVVGFIVERHIKPIEGRVGRLISFISPQVDDAELKALCRSVIGQCSFYATHLPLIAKIESEPMGCNKTCSRLSQQISKFSLLGLGCTQDTIKESLLEVFGECK